MQAKVIYNSVSSQNNFITLNRGSSLGVQKDLGVIDVNNAVVGTVIDVSSNYSVVMSLLHRQSNISARLKKTGEAGSIVWDGLNPRIVIMKEIPKGVKVAIGDTVVTSGYTDRFPYGLLVGTVQDVTAEKSSNNYTLKIKTSADLYNVEYVNVINNLQKEEPKELLKKVKKANE